jgi:hypothetical protein
MIAALGLTSPTCSPSHESGDQGNTSSPDGLAATNTIDLQLGDGADSVSATFQAQDPRTHGQTIEIEVTPADSAITLDSVTLDFVTADGATLHVLLPTDHSCDTEDDQQTCTIRLPMLEARSPGEWQAIASKPDGPAATLNVTVTWEQASPHFLQATRPQFVIPQR